MKVTLSCVVVVLTHSCLVAIQVCGLNGCCLASNLDNSNDNFEDGEED